MCHKLQAQNSCNTAYPRNTSCFKDIIANNQQKITDNDNNEKEKEEETGHEKQ
jgi:hypothetical protein